MSSLHFTSPLEEEEEEDEVGRGDGRPCSSLSTASRSSRIPVLTRSTSLRVKSTSSSLHGTPEGRGGGACGGKSKSEPKSAAGRTGKNIVRSASFVSSRGMSGLTSSFSSSSTTLLSSSSAYHPHPHHPRSTPSHSTPRSHKSLTPELPRRASNSGSNFVRRPTVTIPDRKTQSYAGLGPSWHPSLTSYNHSRRPNFLSVPNNANHSLSSVPTTSGSQPETPSKSPDLDDCDSVKSYGSVSSAVSCDATPHHHHHHHGNGKGGRNLKYVLHCRHTHDEVDPDNYLTPTQRAARRIRELKSQLAEARREVHMRDAEISRLTRELVELRLLKARTQHWDDDTQAVTEADSPTSHHLTHPRANMAGLKSDPEHRRQLPEAHHAPTTPTHKASSATPSEGSEPELSRLMETLTNGMCEAGTTRIPLVSPATRSASETTGDSVELTRSLADSGHYDDLTSPALSARDPFEVSQGSSLRGRPIEEDHEAWQEEGEMAGAGEQGRLQASEEVRQLEEEVQRLKKEVQQRGENQRRNHMEEYHELKEKHNDRVESLLAKLSDANLKYFELRPQYTRSQEQVRELEAEVTRLRQELSEAELRHQKMYLQMFLKGQQAARLQADDEDRKEVEGGVDASDVMTGGAVVELMRQLTTTQDELEKVKGAAPPSLPPLSSPVVRGLARVSSTLIASKAALVDGTQAVTLYFQGRRQALYQREVTCRSSSNNNNNHSNNKRNRELDPEVTLQFLKSAIYYFLTDKDNARGHLRAIESILGYTDRERHDMDRGTK